MINGFKVITLCGSTRFKKEFLEAQKRLTLEGNIVISVGLFGHSGDDVVWTEGVKDMLDRQHLAKIDLADEIFVINVGGYIGDSTRREIAYAEYKGKSISYLEECRKASISDNSIALLELHNSGNYLTKTGKRLVATLTKSVMLPLQNTMHAKALGLISGIMQMLLFVEFYNDVVELVVISTI